MPSPDRTPGTADHRVPRRPSSELTRPVLVAAFPRSAGLRVALDEPLGRAWLEEHGLHDAEISGRHFELGRAGGVVQFRELGSRNGTWVDGRPVPAGPWVALREGAVVRVGSTLLVYRDALSGPFAPSAPLGAMVAPYGLRPLAAAIDGMRAFPPRTVLIEGETGTGKELCARAVAEALARSAPYGAVNVAGVAAGVFESQLFGHVAGAFSDARSASRGVIRAHDGGAVFLDEIGELPLPLQPKLLRLLDNREILPVGAERPALVDVLLLAATNRPLEQAVEEQRFRRDLWARLAPHRLDLPPLRERAEDVFALAVHLAPTFGHALPAEACEVEAVERLMLDTWPDNVRGLLAALAAVRRLDPEPGLRQWAVEHVLGSAPPPAPGQTSPDDVTRALEACGGNESLAARHLGVSRGKLRRLLGKA